nr:hypothetical protein [Propionicimonas sp.]
MTGPDDLMVELGPKGLAAAAKARDAALARGVPGEPPGVTEARRLLAEGADRILFEQAAIREGCLPADWRERDETRQSPEKAPRKPAPAATAPRAARAAQRRLEADAARAARKAQRDARRAEERPPVEGQCSGLTKSGRRCRLMADGDDGRCALHRDRAL